MKRTSIALSLLITLGLAGCSALRYQVVSDHDKFNDRSTVRMANNWVDITRGSALRIDLNAARSVVGTRDTSYYLILIYSGNEWAFIGPDSSLKMILDGDRIALSAMDPKREVGKSFVYEVLYYPVDRTLLKKMGSSKDVSFQLEGDRAYKQCTLTRENIARFAEFARTY